MWAPFVDEHLRRTTRNLLLTNAVLLVALLAVAGMNWVYLYNFFLGPFPMDAKELASGKTPDLSRKYFVTLRGENVARTGVQEFEQKTQSGRVLSETPKADYLVLDLGERGLIVKTSLNAQGAQFSGPLIPLASDLNSHIVRPIEAQRPDLKGFFLPLMLDATGFRSEGYWGLGIGVPLLLLALWNLNKARNRSANPEAHPIVRSLAGFGVPQEIATNIDSEVMSEGKRKAGPVYITASWFLHPTVYDLTVRRLSDLLWVYKKVTKHYTYFIPTGKTCAAVVCDRNGKSFEISCKEKQVDEILGEILRRQPWVVAGHTADIEALWKSNHPAFVQAVDDRRAKMTQPGSAGSVSSS